MRLKVLAIFICLVFNATTAFADVHAELLNAIQIDNPEAVARILKNNPNLKLVDVQDLSSLTVMHQAVSSGNKKIVDLILNFDPQITPQLLATKTSSGLTPLHYAAFQEDVEVLKLMIDFDRELAKNLILAKNSEGATPLHWASLRRTKSVSALLEFDSSKAFTEITDSNGDSALGAAIYRGLSPTVAAFVRSGVSLDEITIRGKKTSAIEFLSTTENYDQASLEFRRPRLELLQHILTKRIESQPVIDWEKP